MKINSTFSRTAKAMIFAFLFAFTFISCQREQFSGTPDEGVNITSYLALNDAQFSQFSKVLKLSGTSAYLNAYGAYTIFAPNNEAMTAYLKTIGKGSVEEISADELKDLVRIHLIEDTIATTKFTDGKIKVPTMFGQYLTTGAVNEGGVTKIIINKIAKIVQGNIRTGNGIVHVIDRVLVPAKLTLTAQIAADPNLSLFNEAVVATGWDVRLAKAINNSPDSKVDYLSVFAETNATFKDAGYNNFTQLKAKYSNTGNPKLLTDSLNLFIAYRLLPGLKYLSDIVSSPSHTTVAPLEVITIKLKGQDILLNEDVFNGVLEPGVLVNRSLSDISATNGVLHVAAGNFAIKKRLPTPVYFSVGDQPEIRQLPSVFRKGGQSVSFAPGQLKDITWGGSLSIIYQCAPPSDKNGYTFWGERIEVTRLRTSGGSDWIEFKTPVIIKGKYKVWVCYRAVGTKGTTAQAKFDGVLMPKLIDFNLYRNTTLSDPELEAQGYKQFTINGNNIHAGRLMGTVDVATTDRHVFRLEALNNASSQTWIAMIHFIPVDQDQLWPRFGPNGEIQNKP